MRIVVGSGLGRSRSARKRATFGVFLILLGVVFLLTRLGYLHYHMWREWWPGILIVLGFSTMITPARPRHIASGLTFILIGFWFFACIDHWYGLTYRTGWPILVMVAGLEMVFASLLDRLEGPKEEHHAQDV